MAVLERQGQFYVEAAVNAVSQKVPGAISRAKSVVRIAFALLVAWLIIGNQAIAQSNATIGAEVSHGWTAGPNDVKGLANAVASVSAQEDWVLEVKTFSHNCSVAGSNCDTRYTDIDAQARAMSNSLSAQLGSGGALEGINAFILIGHSQGTLRNRAALQFGYLDPALEARTIGLVNVGSPGSGAPIIPNGTRFLAYIKYNLDLATYGVWRAFAGIGVLSSEGFRNALFAAEAMTPSKRDMAPGSSFINRLNQDKADQCHYVRKLVWVGWLWWRHKEYRWVRVCKRVTADNRIPGHVAVLDIAGTNNKFSSLMPSTYDMIHGLGYPMSVAAIGFWSISWQIWPIPIATGLTNLSYTMLTFDYQWQTRVVGSREGDATVTLDSQTALARRKHLFAGRDPSMYTIIKIHSTHSDEPNAAAAALKQFFKLGGSLHKAYMQAH